MSDAKRTKKPCDRPPRELRVCRAIRLLAEGKSTEEVVGAVHVRPATLAKWRASEDFRTLVRCLEGAGALFAALNDLMPGAVEALHKALAGEGSSVAVQAAREVLNRVEKLKDVTERTIRVEYMTHDGKPYSSTPWAERHPRSSGTLQGGCVRETLREDGDGEESDH